MELEAEVAVRLALANRRRPEHQKRTPSGHGPLRHIACFHVTASCNGRLPTGDRNQEEGLSSSPHPPPLRLASTLAHDLLLTSAWIPVTMAARTGFNKNNSGALPVKRRGVQRRLILDTAVKRIMQEAKELANDPCTDYAAAPLEVTRSTIVSTFTSF